MLPFPRAAEFELEEPPALRRFARSLVAFAALTGVAVRLLRLLVLTAGFGESWWRLALAVTLGGVVLLGAVTVHLGNYPIQRWLWRAPAFVAVEVLAELATSALLIAAGVEMLGSSHAGWDAWPVMLRSALLSRVPFVCGYALLLAGVVQAVRGMLRRRREAAEG